MNAILRTVYELTEAAGGPMELLAIVVAMVLIVAFALQLVVIVLARAIPEAEDHPHQAPVLGALKDRMARRRAEQERHDAA